MSIGQGIGERMVGVGVGEDSGSGVGEGRVSLGLGAGEGSEGYHQLNKGGVGKDTKGMYFVVLKRNSFMRLILLTRNFMLLICDSSAYYAIRVWQLLFIRDFCVGD